MKARPGDLGDVEATNAAWEAVEDDCAEVLSNLCRTRTVVADRLGVVGRAGHAAEVLHLL